MCIMLRKRLLRIWYIRRKYDRGRQNRHRSSRDADSNEPLHDHGCRSVNDASTVVLMKDRPPPLRACSSLSAMASLDFGIFSGFFGAQMVKKGSTFEFKWLVYVALTGHRGPMKMRHRDIDRSVPTTPAPTRSVPTSLSGLYS
jgi:hypothetical protein